MSTSHSQGPSNAPDSYFGQRRSLEGQRCSHKLTLTHMAALLLVTTVAILLIWAQPAAAAVSITEFKVSTVGVPQGITAGPDGNLWFTLFYDNVVGRITPNGTTTLFRLNTQNSATYITKGPDGALWVTLLNDVGGSSTNLIGRLTTKGVLTTFTVPKASYIWDITTGPDNNLWFTDGASRAWRVTTTGHFTAFSFNDSTGGYPYQITKGPDGNLWFTDRAHEIVKMTTSGQFTVFKVPTTNAATDDITAGPDGNLWFTLDGSQSYRFGRITPSGAITLFTFSSHSNDSLLLSGITTGPDGNLWFTYEDWNTKVSAIGRLTRSGTITLFPTPTASQPISLRGQMATSGSQKPSRELDASRQANR